MLAFGMPLFFSGLLVFILMNADNFIIGSAAGATVLWFYAIAFNWSTVTPTLVSEVVHTVLFPTFSRI
jgi:PST family polysaccharide transporter/lipopolysaccharide exporter